jgi:hypothetical protein
MQMLHLKKLGQKSKLVNVSRGYVYTVCSRYHSHFPPPNGHRRAVQWAQFTVGVGGFLTFEALLTLLMFKHMPNITHIHSFKHSLSAKLFFLTIKYSSILKVMGLYTIYVSRKYVFAVWCLQMHCFKSTTSYRCIRCSFPNNLTNVIINPKTRFCFGRLGFSLLCSSLLWVLLLF